MNLQPAPPSSRILCLRVSFFNLHSICGDVLFGSPYNYQIFGFRTWRAISCTYDARAFFLFYSESVIKFSTGNLALDDISVIVPSRSVFDFPRGFKRGKTVKLIRDNRRHSADIDLVFFFLVILLKYYHRHQKIPSDI